MKVFLFLVIFSTSLMLQAETAIRFEADNSGATVAIFGQQDTDAIRLYQAMNVEVIDEEILLRKTILLERMQDSILYLTCTKIKDVQIATCTLNFIPSFLTKIDKDQKIAKFEVIDSYSAPKIASLFVKTNDSIVFQSLNAKFKIWKSFSSYGRVSGFTVEYLD